MLENTGQGSRCLIIAIDFKEYLIEGKGFREKNGSVLPIDGFGGHSRQCPSN